MNYATWDIYFPAGSKEGYTADQEIVTKGGTSMGLIYVDATGKTILGWYSDNADITGLEKYNFTPVTENEALVIMQNFSNLVTGTIDPVAVLPDGQILFPALNA